MRFLLACFIAAMFCASPAWADARVVVKTTDYVASYRLPEEGKRFVLGFQHEDETTGVITEYVPEGETVDDWSEMVTFQLLPIQGNQMDNFISLFEQKLVESCPTGKVMDMEKTVENGMTVYRFRSTCEKANYSGKPEATLYKFVATEKGGIFAIQRAIREIRPLDAWKDQINSLNLCDVKLHNQKTCIEQAYQ